LVFALMVLGLAKVGAQNDRNFIRQGNRAYHKQKWAAAETQYRKAISKNQKNAQAVYNLGCALMMQQKDSMAMIQFENASKLETNKMRRARSYHNMGVAMVQQAFGVSVSYQDIAARERLAALCARFPLLAEVAVKGPEGTGEGRSA
jgi:Ca-activated chloride channel family protein